METNGACVRMSVFARRQGSEHETMEKRLNGKRMRGHCFLSVLRAAGRGARAFRKGLDKNFALFRFTTKLFRGDVFAYSQSAEAVL